MRGLIARGHGAELVAARGTPLEERALQTGIHVHGISARFPRASMVRTLRRLLREQKFDVVHAHDPHGLTAAWLAGAHRRASLIVSRRVAYPLSSGRLSMARYRAARRIIAVSRFVDASVVTSGLEPSRITVVHDGVPVPPPFDAAQRRKARAHWDVDEKDWLLGCVGYLLPEKGQEALLQTLALLREKQPQCRLLLAGRGPYRSHLEGVARDLRILDRVKFTGFIKDVDSVYAALDFFLFPSLAEPLGSSLLDAMARGIPSIAVASGGIPEILIDGKNGRLLLLPEPGAFAAAISRLIQNPEEAARLGAAGRAAVMDHFSDDHMVDGTLGVYMEALSRPPRAG
jgi:glycosyltransferase involved in cell wall biosynthesis